MKLYEITDMGSKEFMRDYFANHQEQVDEDCIDRWGNKNPVELSAEEDLRIIITPSFLDRIIYEL